MAQREIKFRAWDGKQMLTMDTERYSYPVFVCKDGYTWLNWDSLIKMQHTGLRDKNGLEIYEGDVVAVSGLYDPETGQTETDIAVVEYVGVSLAYVEHFANEGEAGRKVTYVADIIGHGCDEDDDCVVIGNIYEHPELLEP